MRAGRVRLTLAAAAIVALMPAPSATASGSVSGSHAKSSAIHRHQQAAHLGHSGAVVLALGSGYSSRTDAARVRVLQRRLDAAGYAPGPIDGRYGPRTEQAVIRFQAAHGLWVDGIAGPQTFAAMSRPFHYPGAGYAGRGSGAVRVLQRRLDAAGYAPGPIDGRYGPRTEQAVIRFQAAHGLRVDGIAGPQTFAGLERVRDSQRRASRPKPSSRVKPSPPSALHRGASGVEAPRSRGRASRPAGSSSKGLPALLLALVGPAALLVLLAVVGPEALAGGRWLLQRRRGERVIVTPTAPSAEQTRAAEHEVAEAPAEVGREMAGLKPARAPGSEPDSDLGRSDLSGEVSQDSAAAPAIEFTALLGREGDLAAIEEEYRRADERGDPVAASNLGVLLERRGDLAGAEKAYRRADERGDINGAFNLGRLLAERGYLTAAAAAVRRADPEAVRPPPSQEAR